MNSNIKAVVLALAGFAIFALHDVAIKVLGGSYSTFQIIFFSVVFGFPLVTLLLLRDKTVDTLIPHHPFWVIGRAIATVIGGAGAFYAFSTLPLAQTYAILFAIPLLITLMAIPMLGEKVGIHRGAAVLAGLVGVIVVVQPGSTELGLGHLGAAVATVCSAFASVIVRKIGREERSVVLILYPMVANFVVMAAALPFVYQPMPLQDLALNFVIAFLALAAMFCLIAAYQRGSAAVVAPMQYSQIIWAAIFGAMFFGEQPDWMTGLGAGIIILSGVYIVWRENNGEASENMPVLRTRSRFATPSAPRVSTLLSENAKPDLPSKGPK